jgi:hypothetical protein
MKVTAINFLSAYLGRKEIVSGYVEELRFTRDRGWKRFTAQGNVGNKRVQRRDRIIHNN